MPTKVESPGPSTLGEIRAAVNGPSDSKQITFLAKALRQAKATLRMALTSEPSSSVAIALVSQLADVSPLPSPAYAGNLLSGQFELLGSLGGKPSTLVEALGPQRTLLSLDPPPPTPRLSKNGFSLQQGSVLLVHSQVGGPTEAALVCSGPRSFDLALACDNTFPAEGGPQSSSKAAMWNSTESWEVLFLDQELLAVGWSSAASEESGIVVLSRPAAGAPK